MVIFHSYSPRRIDGSESWVAPSMSKKKMGHRWLNSPKKRAVEPSMSLKMTYFLRSSALVSPYFFYHIKLPFWDIDGATPGELRHLCPKKAAWCWEKKWGETSAVPIFHLGSPPENGPHQVSSFLWKTQEKALLPGTWWGPFSGAKQSGKLPERRRLQKKCHF